MIHLLSCSSTAQQVKEQWILAVPLAAASTKQQAVQEQA
jgi:hypothetical protein